MDIVVTSHLNHTTKLYMFDILDLIQPIVLTPNNAIVYGLHASSSTIPSILYQSDYDVEYDNNTAINNDHQSSSSTVDIPSVSSTRTSIKGKPRITAEQIKWCIDCHISNNHIPFSKMASSIREGLYSGVPSWLSQNPSILEHIGNKQPCIPCEVARRKMVIHYGTGTSPHVIGSHWSVDYQHYNVESTFGSTGNFLFEELSTGLLFAIATTSKALLSEAINIVHDYGRHYHVVFV
jgi:hypothetical protein